MKLPRLSMLSIVSEQMFHVKHLLYCYQSLKVWTPHLAAL